MAVSYKIDRISFELGMINTFVEMVACGVKPMAISPPIDPADLPLIEAASKELCEGFGIDWYVEKSLMITDIQSADFTRGKNSILYYRDPAILDSYIALKQQADRLTEQGLYQGKQRREISMAFGKMLGYPNDVLRTKVDSEKRIDPVILSGKD